jgi:thiol:disulfide interchange protein
MSMVVWALTLHGRSRTVVATISVASLALIAWATGANITKFPEPQQAVLSGEAGTWQPWQAARVEQLLASGQPVFVDFTAAWCVTCQYNKKTTLDRPDLLAEMADRKIALLRADWTRRDPAITAALAQLGRNGVPVYVFYSRDRPPIVMSELLTVDDMRSAMAGL